MLTASVQSEPTTAPCDRHTDLSDIAAVLRKSLDAYLAGETRTPVDDPARDAALADYRVRGQVRVIRDLDANLASIKALLHEVGRKCGFATIGNERDLFAALLALRAEIVATDPYGPGAVEESCWILVQQFYCNAIECTQRLLAWDAGKPPRSLPRDDSGALLRRNVMGIGGPSRLQALMNTVEVAIPNPFATRLCRTMLPTLLHMMRHQLIPWGALRWRQFERTTLGWLSPNGFARLRGEREVKVRIVGRENLIDNPDLFDLKTRQTPHNLIIAAAHRLGFMDFPFFAEVLRDTPHFVWANNSFYTPGMAKKLARSRSAIPIRGVGRMPFADAIDLTIRVFEEDRIPLFIMADGSTRNLLYGQYLRVKRGIRVLVDECARRGRKSGRRTFVAPMTFDDPIAYLLGFDDEIRVRMHPPIEITEPTTDEPHKSLFDENAFNGGDPLLNQLEATYLLHSLQAREGIYPPDVVASVRNWRDLKDPGVRGFLRRRFNMSVYDLCRMSAAIHRRR